MASCSMTDASGTVIRPTAQHLAALQRRRRIIDQLDASDVLITVGSAATPHDWLAFVFGHVDSTPSAGTSGQARRRTRCTSLPCCRHGSAHTWSRGGQQGSTGSGR
eukprot:SAG11_NODE_17769_length_509_cov_1.153659_1_plen_105_part_10